MKFEAFVIISALPLPLKTVGVPQDGSSFRTDFQTVPPVFMFAASRNDSFCVSHYTRTMSL